MEMDDESKILQKCYSDNIIEVEEGLNYISKKMKSENIKKILMDKDNNLNLEKIYSKKQNYTNAKISSLLPDLLNKISILKDENVILSFNGCGGCLMSIIFIIVGNCPSLETKFYNFIINYLGDYDGVIFEKKSFNIMAQKVAENFNESNKEICERFNNNIWKDYLQATGTLFGSNEFVDKAKENPKKVNEFIEDYIKKHDSFNKDNAKKILQLLINESVE